MCTEFAKNILAALGSLATASCATSSGSQQHISYADPMQQMSINFDLSERTSYVAWKGAIDIVTSPITECPSGEALAYCIVSDHLPLFVLPALTKTGELPSLWDFEGTKFELIEAWKSNHGSCTFQIISIPRDSPSYRIVFLYDSIIGLRTIFYLSPFDEVASEDDRFQSHDVLFTKHLGLGAGVFSPICTTKQ